jgi:DNA invertase Pin-like site-specific DNA recombinase
VTTPETQTSTLIGYARISTAEQSLDMQTAALIKAGVDPRMIFSDTIGGTTKKQRKGRESALRQLRAGDTLLVWKMDRISRSLFDLMTLLNTLEEMGAKFRSLTEPMIDTTTPMGRMLVGVIGAIAQFERDLIQQRSKEGVRRAQERGVRFGQPTIFTPENQAKIAVWIREGQSAKQIAVRLGCHEGTVRRVYTFPVLEAIRSGRKVSLKITSKDKGQPLLKVRPR